MYRSRNRPGIFRGLLHLEQGSLKVETRDLSALEQSTLAQTKGPWKRVFSLQLQPLAVTQKGRGHGMYVLIFPEYPPSAGLWVKEFLNQE